MSDYISPYLSGREKNFKIGISSYTENKTSLEVIGKVGIGTANATSSLHVVGDEYVTGVVTATTFYGTFSGNASSATYATNAGVATYATNAGVATYATNAGVATYAPNAGVATYADNAGIATYATNAGVSTYATNSGIATYATNAGIATYATNSGIATYATNAGIATYATNSGIATYATIAGYSTSSGISTDAIKLQTPRTFEITGDIVGAAVTFDGTGNVSIAATIQPNSVGLGTDTTGDYVQSITGTSNQIDVSVTSGEGSAPILSIPNQFTAPQDVTVIRDLQVNRNLNVDGNITIGGTSATIFSQSLSISDPDIVLGYRTDAFGNDISNDNTANHGGVALASTEGTPLVDLFIAGIETNPSTYKKIMWFKAGTFAGLGTDAWLFNYAVGIGSTQFPTGTRLAAGSVQFTENDLAVVRNINSTGVITATSGFSGNASSASYATIAGYSTSSGIATYATNAGVSTYADNSGIATYATNAGVATYATIAGYSTSSGIATYADNSGIATYATIAGYSTSSGIATYATNAGVATYATIAGYSTSQGIATYAPNAGIATYATSSGIATYAPNAGIATYTPNAGISTYADNAGIATYATNAGIATYATNAGVATYATNAGIATDVIGGIASVTQLSVSGFSTVGVLTATSIGIGTTNPTVSLWVGGSGYFIGSVSSNNGFYVNGSLIGSGSISGADIVGTALSISGISTLGTVKISSGIITSTNSGVVTYYGDGRYLQNVVGFAVSLQDPVSEPVYPMFANNIGVTTAGISTTQLVFTPSSGNLGLGSTNPDSKLAVIGDVYVSGVVTATTFYGSAAGLTDIPPSPGQINITDTSTNAPYYPTFTVGAGFTDALNITSTKLSFNPSSGSLTVSVGPVLIGSGTSTGTADQDLQVTGGAYISSNTGIGTTNPSQTLHVQGNARITGAFRDSTDSPGTTNQVLLSTITGTQWGGFPSPSNIPGLKIFDTSIDDVLYVQPTGTLDRVGVGTTVTQITTFPSGSNRYVIHSIHVTNISNGDAEITGGFLLNSRAVPASISVSVGQSGGPGINAVTVGSASTILVGASVNGTGNIGETTGIGTTAGFQYNTYVTSVDGNVISLSKPMSGRAVGVATFTPVSKFASRLPVPVGSAVELLKQPMILNALDSIVLQSTGISNATSSTSTAAISQTANSNILTVTAGAAILNFIAAGQLIQGTGTNTGIQTNTFVGVGYTPGSLSVPMTRPATSTLASQILTFTEVVTPQDGALQATIVYQSSTDTSYLNGTGTVAGISSTTTSITAGLSTVPVPYYATGLTYPSTVQSIRVSNISDDSIYPGGDYPVWVGIGNSDTIFAWLAYNMVIPKNSSIELCEGPKRLGIGQSIFAYASTPYTIEIQVAGKQKTS